MEIQKRGVSFRSSKGRTLPNYRCRCGCASINLSIEGLPEPSGGMHILADFIFGTDEKLSGIFVWEQSGVLTIRVVSEWAHRRNFVDISGQWPYNSYREMRMPMASTARVVPRQKAERLETRVTHDQKQLIERAALVQGRTVSDFVAVTLQEAARRAIEEITVWQLSQNQQQVFVEALQNSPAPNEHLRAAHRRYQEYKNAVASGTR